MNKKILIIGVAVLVLIFIMVLVVISRNFLVKNPVLQNTTNTQMVVTATNQASGEATSTLSRTNGYAINLPNALMLVDSQGRRTGKDPATGILYHEIPGTAYEEDSLSPHNGSGELTFSAP